MPQLTDVNRFIELSRKARSLDGLNIVMESITHEMGFDYYALVQHVDIRRSNSQDTIWLENYPKSWAEAFVAHGLYASDPIHVASQSTNVGFLWSDVSNIIKMTAHQRRVLEQAQREGLGDGFTVPAHLPGVSNGTCSFGVRYGRDVPEENLMMAQLVGAFAFEAGRKIATLRARENYEKPKLTTRQLECLTLIARGKTDGEIATILGVKESTVRDYVEEACARYDVRRRVQLVVRSIHDGQLILRDAIG